MEAHFILRGGYGVSENAYQSGVKKWKNSLGLFAPQVCDPRAVRGFFFYYRILVDVDINTIHMYYYIPRWYIVMLYKMYW